MFLNFKYVVFQSKSECHIKKLGFLIEIQRFFIEILGFSIEKQGFSMEILGFQKYVTIGFHKYQITKT